MNRKKFIQLTTMGILCIPFIKLKGEEPKKKTFLKIYRTIAADGTKGGWIGIHPIKYKDIQIGDSIVSFDEYTPKGILWEIHGRNHEGILIANIEKELS